MQKQIPILTMNNIFNFLILKYSIESSFVKNH